MSWFYYPSGYAVDDPGQSCFPLREDTIPIDAIGFVYLITSRDTGKIYVGKKAFTHTRKTRISAREKKATGTRCTFKKTAADSKWRDYYGSCKELQEEIKIHGKDRFDRTILTFAYSKKQLSYLEVKYQMLLEVLEKDSYNGNVLGRFYRKDAKP